MPESDKILTNTKIADFLGLDTNTDPRDLKPGEMVSQINCGGPIAGKLRSRPGLVPQSFSGGNGGTSNQVWVATSMVVPNARYIVYQRANGEILIGKNPADT